MLRTMHFVIEKVKGRKWTKTQKKERENMAFSVCSIAIATTHMYIYLCMLFLSVKANKKYYCI